MSTTYEVQYRDHGSPWVRYVDELTLQEARKLVAGEKRADAAYRKSSGAVVTTQYRIVRVTTTVVSTVVRKRKTK